MGSIIGVNAAIKQLQEPIADWKWSCKETEEWEI